jgi:hypothetical protein
MIVVAQLPFFDQALEPVDGGRDIFVALPERDQLDTATNAVEQA